MLPANYPLGRRAKGGIIGKISHRPGAAENDPIALRGACHVRWQRWAKLANRLQGRGLMHSVAVAAAPSPYARDTHLR